MNLTKSNRWMITVIGLSAVFFVAFCNGSDTKNNTALISSSSTTTNATITNQTSEFKIASSVFEEGEAIPEAYSCDGDDTSPPLQWENAPTGTKSFALICDDPDAPNGTWIHWILFNIPATQSKLDANVPKTDTLSNQAIHGANSWGRKDYGGPCPPSGTHHYYFKLYALDVVLSASAGTTKDELLALMTNHILKQTQIIGTYTHKE